MPLNIFIYYLPIVRVFLVMQKISKADLAIATSRNRSAFFKDKSSKATIVHAGFFDFLQIIPAAACITT